jgi:hypothetical protein
MGVSLPLSRAMNQAVSRRPLSAEDRVRNRVNLEEFVVNTMTLKQFFS